MSETITLHVKDLKGGSHAIKADPALTLMEAIRESGLPILALCGGCCSCSTCHVYVDEKWLEQLGPRSDEEEDTLDQALDLRDNSRLSCQIKLSGALNGLSVTLSDDTRVE